MSIIQRTVPPNKFINEPFGTIHHIEEDGKSQFYIQVSQTEIPHWMPMGDFLVSVFSKELTNKEFMDSCLDVFRANIL